jgi:hypothetical protein
MRMMLKVLCAGVLLCGLTAAASGQGSAGTAANVEPRFLIDAPTAGMLPEGSFTLDLDFYQRGGVLCGLTFGLLQRLTVGLSYGGSRLIGSDEPDWNKLPGVNLKLRLFEESNELPAIAIGFDSQGRDGYVRALDRYLMKSPGFYAVASRNYAWLGDISMHGGVNYSLERGDDDSDVSGFIGVEKSIGTSIALTAEYNLASNDSDNRALGKGRGYLNFGIRWSTGGGLTLGLNVKDVLRNLRDVEAINRTVRLEYAKFF